MFLSWFDALGTGGYGTLQALLAFPALLGAADLGLGTAVRTKVGQLAGARQRSEIATVVGDALIVLVVATSCVCVGGAFLVWRFDEVEALNLPVQYAPQIETALIAVLAYFWIRVPVSVFVSAFAGLEILSELTKVTVLGYIVSSLGAILCATFTSRIDFTLVAQLAPNAISSILVVFVGLRKAPDAVPSLTRGALRRGLVLARDGLRYFAIQVSAYFVNGVDSLVVAKLCGANAVAGYAIASRLVAICFSLVHAVGGSFWNGVANALGAGDWQWISMERERIRRNSTLLMGFLMGALIAVSVPVVAIWTGGRVGVSLGVVTALAVWAILYSYVTADTAFLNGIGRIRWLVPIVLAEGGVKLSLSWGLGAYFAQTGVAIATAIATLICQLVPVQKLANGAIRGKGIELPVWSRELVAAALLLGAGYTTLRLISVVFPTQLVLQGIASTACYMVLALLLARILYGARP